MLKKFTLFATLACVVFAGHTLASDRITLSKLTTPAKTSTAKSTGALGLVTGSKTGTYYRFGKDMEAVLSNAGTGLNVKESSGSVLNIQRITSPENASLGIVQSDVLGFLKRSDDEASQKIANDLRLVFPLYQEEVHTIASKEIKDFKDLEGKTVVVGPKGSGSWLTSVNLFNLTGVTPDKFLRMKPEEGLVAVLKGQADAMIYVAGKPVKLFRNMEQLKEHEDFASLLGNVHFLPLEGEKLTKEYSESTITAEDYNFVEKDVPTIAVSAVLVSFDFSKGGKYSKKRCNDIQQFSRTVSEQIGMLKEKGHPKWKEVDLSAEVTSWERDSCAYYEVVEKDDESNALEDALLDVLTKGTAN